jgi:c-di-GMP-binding flagellar brake protein YcgR
MTAPGQTEMPTHERRAYPRYFVTSHITLAIENESLKKSLGIGEPEDISLGGLRVTNLPAWQEVHVGDQLGLLLIDRDDALTLHGEVVHARQDSIGVRFCDLSPMDKKAVTGVIERLHSRL